MGNPAEELAAKTMGAMKKAKASLEGLTGIFRDLVQDHGEASVLLFRLDSTEDPQARAALFPELKKALLSHEEGEKQVLYPALREYPETAQIADRHDQEATQLHQMIEAVSSLSYSDADWRKHLSALADLVKKHVDEEESQFFPAGQKVLGERADALREQFRAAKQSVMNRMP